MGVGEEEMKNKEIGSLWNGFVKSKYFYPLLIVSLLFVYILLAFKNPFADNSLISNIEPYPDTLLYAYPSWNWVNNGDWSLSAWGKEVRVSVPNTYGYYLTPFYKMFGDIRSFYIANIFLGIGAIVFFGLALRNLLGDKKWYIVAYSGFLLVTNFYFFNKPQLAMAENVNYLLVSIFIYFLSVSFKWKQLFLMIPFVVISGYLKNTNMVLAGSFLLAFVVKIMSEKMSLKNIKIWLGLGLVFGVGLVLFYLPKMLTLSPNAFGLKFFDKNFDFYFSCLTGGECRNLWYWQRLVSRDIVSLFFLGVGLMIADKTRSSLIVQLLLPLVLLVLAMSVFVDTEGRHVEVLVPIMLAVGALGLNKMLNKFKWPMLVIAILVLVNLALTSYQPVDWEVKAVSLKKQVGLNLRHREDPWNYLCLRMVEDYMVDKDEAYFGSFLPIYLFRAYEVDINYLPLANDQDFMNGRGLRDYFPPPLKDIYDQKLREGREIYVSDNYASNGRDAWRHQWDVIMADKNLEKVYQSPLDNCNIYKITLKDEE